jgi:hypothetical protein
MALHTGFLIIRRALSTNFSVQIVLAHTASQADRTNRLFTGIERTISVCSLGDKKTLVCTHTGNEGGQRAFEEWGMFFVWAVRLFRWKAHMFGYYFTGMA